MERERFFDPNHMDAGFDDDQLRSSHDARTISAAIRADEDGDDHELTPEELALQHQLQNTIAEISEREGHRRATLHGSDWVKSALRQTVDVKRAKKFASVDRKLFGATRKAFDEDNRPIAPDKSAPNFQAVKSAADIVVTLNSRLSRTQRAEGRPQLQRQVELDKIRSSIQARMKDRPTSRRGTNIGQLLEAARQLLELGEWDSFVASIPMSRSASFAFIAKQKESKESS